MLPATVFLDGGYIRQERKNAGLSEQFDPRKPAMFVQNQRVAAKQVCVGRVYYYDAPDPDLDEAGQDAQRAYFDKIMRLPDTHVVLGELRKGSKKREQKGVDVRLAIDAMRAANSQASGVVALVTGDGDFAPLARAIRETGPTVVVLAFKNSASDGLLREADRVQLWDEVPSDWDLK